MANTSIEEKVKKLELQNRRLKRRAEKVVDVILDIIQAGDHYNTDHTNGLYSDNCGECRQIRIAMKYIHGKEIPRPHGI
jgi:hypothetical protein